MGSTISAGTWPARWRSTSAPRPAASPTCCSSAARRRSSRSTSAPTSSPGSCGRIRGSIVHEQTNARYLTEAIVTEPVDLVVCDASFISLAKVLDKALEFARPGGRLLALVKPQFEAERAEIGKGGVVRDPAVHARVCAEAGLGRTRLDGQGVTPSPITGPEGNVEFLMAAVKG